MSCPETDMPVITITPAPRTGSPASGPRMAGLLEILFGDLLGPIAVYHAAQAAGSSAGQGLVFGGLVCLPRQPAALVRSHRLDGLGIAVLMSLTLGAALSLVSGSARFLVAKDAIWPLAAGAVAAASCLRGKPVTFFMVRPVLTGGRVENRPFWDGMWADDAGAPFRRCLRVLAAAWTAILLAAGTAESALAFTLPLNRTAAASLMAHVIAPPGLLGFTAIYAKNTGMGVRQSLEARTTEDGA